MLDLNYKDANFDNCCYTNKLLKKLFYLNKISNNRINIKEVKKAIYYAKKFHGTQKRQTGEPYFSHPLEVAYIVSDYIFKTHVIVTSILHDVLEDTIMTKPMLTNLFGSKIAEQVCDLTKIKQDKKQSFIEMLNLLINQKKYEVLLIKCIDRFHNLQTLTVKSQDKQKKTLKETLYAFFILTTSLELGTDRKIEISKFSTNLLINEINMLIKRKDLEAINYNKTTYGINKGIIMVN